MTIEIPLNENPKALAKGYFDAYMDCIDLLEKRKEKVARLNTAIAKLKDGPQKDRLNSIRDVCNSDIAKLEAKVGPESGYSPRARIRKAFEFFEVQKRPSENQPPNSPQSSDADTFRPAR